MPRILRITDASSRLVINPGLSEYASGFLVGWSTIGSPQTGPVENVGAIESLTGSICTEVRNATGSTAIRGIYQEIGAGKLIAGRDYYIKVWVKPVSGTAWLYVWDGLTTNNQVTAESTTANEWQMLTVRKTATSDGIRIGYIALDPGDHFYADLCQIATFNVEFIDGDRDALFRVTNWEIEIPDFKGSGVFSASALSEGRRLIDGVWDNVEQTISFHVRGDSEPTVTNQADLGSRISELLSALQAVRDYQISSWARDPIYIEHKSEFGNGLVYAMLINARIPQLADQFSIEYLQLVMKDLDLIIEHTIPSHLPPGHSQAVLAGVLEAYNGQNYGNIDASDELEPRGDWMFLGNRHGLSNITNMHLGSGGSNLIGGSFPRAAAADNTITYFGIDSSISGAGPFAGLVFHVSRAAVPNTASGVWEIYQASPASWVSIAGFGYDGTLGFTQEGWVALGFSLNGATGWGTVSPGGGLPTGWWIRYRVTGTYTTAPQIDREIFTPNWNFIDIPPGATWGNVPALAGFHGVNYGGPAASRIGRVILGLRSLSRGADFRSVIDLTDRQNHSDVSVTLSGFSVVAEDSEQLIGYVTEQSSSGEDYVEVLITGDLAAQYLGEFRVFARIHYSPNSATVLQLSYAMGSGMPYEQNEANQVLLTSGQEVLDLGVMAFDDDVLGGIDSGQLKIRITATTTVSGLQLSTLYIMPVDEYQLDASLGDNPPSVLATWSDDGGQVIGGSVFHARTQDRAHILPVSGGFGTPNMKARYVVKSNGPMILQAGGWQRLHFLLLSQGSSATPPFSFFVIQDAIVAIRLYANYRYLAMRG